MAKENPNKFQQALEFAKAAQAKIPKREVPNGVEPFVEFDQKTGISGSYILFFCLLIYK